MFSELLGIRFDNLAERRRTDRFGDAQLSAYYWNGDVPVAHGIRDVSGSGIFITTDERWYLGTILRLTLDFKKDGSGGTESDSQVETVHVWAKVVRQDAGGVGFAFMLIKASERKRMAELVKKARKV
jgi:hypothetical protein